MPLHVKVSSSASCRVSVRRVCLVLGEDACWGAHPICACRCQAADLSKNGIGVRGTTALVEALQQNETLQTLILDTNSIGDEGAEILAKHLSSAHLLNARHTLTVML